MKFTHVVALVLLAMGLAACQKPKQVQPEVGTPSTTTEGSGAATSGLGTETTGTGS